MVQTRNVQHQFGTYPGNIPTAITYTNMPIGNISANDNYTFNVKEAIPDGDKVALTAETGRTRSSNGTEAQIFQTTTQGKSEWSVDDCYASEIPIIPSMIQAAQIIQLILKGVVWLKLLAHMQKR